MVFRVIGLWIFASQMRDIKRHFQATGGSQTTALLDEQWLYHGHSDTVLMQCYSRGFTIPACSLYERPSISSCAIDVTSSPVRLSSLVQSSGWREHTATGTPAEAWRSGFGGEKRDNKISKLSPLGGGVCQRGMDHSVETASLIENEIGAFLVAMPAGIENPACSITPSTAWF